MFVFKNNYTIIAYSENFISPYTISCSDEGLFHDSSIWVIITAR